jgi:hypothetical protein
VVRSGEQAIVTIDPTRWSPRSPDVKKNKHWASVMIKGCAERAAASLSEPRYRPLLKRSLPRVGHYQVSSAVVICSIHSPPVYRSTV